MEMLKLLNPDNFTYFYLRADLVEKVLPARGNCCEILTTTGRWVLCGESPAQVADMVRAAEQGRAPDAAIASANPK